MNYRRRSQGSARRKAEAKLIEESLAEPDSKREQPLVDSQTTRATPVPYDESDTEESLP
jgi:hypothetical protein